MSLNLTESSKLNLGLDVISSPSGVFTYACNAATVYPIPEWRSIHGADLMQVPSLEFKPMSYTNLYRCSAFKSRSVLRVALSFLSLP